MSYISKVKNYLKNDAKFLKMQLYVNLIEKNNQVMNLTGFSNEKLWKEGVYESLICFDNLNLDGKILDIGSGVGFPGMPLLIAYPHIKLNIIEVKNKRINFLKKVAQKLNLQVNFINKRAEEVSNLTFDLITARAVAPLFKLIEMSYHLGNINSLFYLIKGKNVHNELKDATTIIKKLQIKNIEIINKEVDKKQIKIVKYFKTKANPKGFPRKWSEIKKY